MLQCCLASEHKAANCHVLDGMEYVCCMCDFKDKFLVSGAPRLWAKSLQQGRNCGPEACCKAKHAIASKTKCMHNACLNMHASCMSSKACKLHVSICMPPACFKMHAIFACLMPPCFQATFESKQAKSPCTVRWPTWKQKLLQLSMHAWTSMHMQLLLHFPCGTVCSLY